MNKTDQLVQAQLVQQYRIKHGRVIWITVYTKALGKPRMTQRDKFKPAAQRYFAYKDEVRRQVKIPLWRLPEPLTFSWRIWLPIPPSVSQAENERRRGTGHRFKPDKDTLDKALMDILFSKDERIVGTRFQEKIWEDFNKPRIEMELRW